MIVIGAGAIGSYVAYKLAEKGYGVAVLEKKEKVGEQICCTGIIGRECVRSFAIEDDVILRQVNSAQLYSPSGKSIRLWRRETQAYILDRAAFDRSLADRARNKAVDYVLNSMVNDIEVGDNRVKIGAVSHKQRLKLEARAAVIATGFGSRLTESLGLGRIGDFVIGAQAEVKTRGVNDIEVYFGREIAPGFFGWLVPTITGRALVGLLSRHSPGHYLRRLLSSLSVQGKIALVGVELGQGGIPLKPLSRTYSERLVVIGDAAGQVKPTSGGGIYYGLLCADIAANTLYRALETDTLSAMGLADYEREWKKKLGRELQVGYWARKLYERLSDRQVDRVFDIMKSDGIDKALADTEELSFDWHGEGMLRMVGYGALSRVMRVMKLPINLTRG